MCVYVCVEPNPNINFTRVKFFWKFLLFIITEQFTEQSILFLLYSQIFTRQIFIRREFLRT